jgi:hypothetical protein
MKTLLFVAACAIGLLAFFAATHPASAVRSWSYWPNAGYCNPGTCTRGGGFRARNLRFCRPEYCKH